GPVSEFHFFCDPLGARQVVHAGMNLTLIPLDVSRKILFAPTDLSGLPDLPSRTGQFLRHILPFGIAATANLYGIEGFHLKDVLGISGAAPPESLRTRAVTVDVELRGELTRGMSVIDQRPWRTATPNVHLAVEVDAPAARTYMDRILQHAG